MFNNTKEAQQFANNYINNNRNNIVNNDFTKEMINVIQSGDSKRGEEIAYSILNTYGITKEQAMQQVMSKFFNK